MKKYLGLILLILLSLGACKNSSGDGHSVGASHEKDLLYYTCPMHPQVKQETPGQCPICGMDLVPVYKESSSQELVEDPSKPKTLSVQIDPSKQSLAGIQTTKVQEGPVMREIRTTGRVAFDPQLAVAIKEYQEVSKTVPSLKEAAIVRLKHLGLSDQEIAGLSDRHDHSTTYHLLQTGGSLWIYANLFEDETAVLHGGEKARIELAGGIVVTGVLRSLSPMVDAGTRTVRGRIEVAALEDQKKLRPDTFVTVTLEIPLGNKIFVPKSAIINTGKRQVVFLKKGDNHFEENNVVLGSETPAGVVVESGLKEGDLVVTSAAFLVDSETQLRGN